MGRKVLKLTQCAGTYLRKILSEHEGHITTVRDQGKVTKDHRKKCRSQACPASHVSRVILQVDINNDGHTARLLTDVREVSQQPTANQIYNRQIFPPKA